MFRVVAALGVVLCAAIPAAQAAPDDYLAHLAAIVERRLAELAARPPKPVPPKPVAVKWKAVRLGSIDLGAPLVAMTSGDLDGDGAGELYAVTSREVVAITLRANKPVELGRVAFGGDRAVPTPRDVVGTAVIDGRELVASASLWARELRVTVAGKLAGQAGGTGFLVCPGDRWQLAPGRNYFPSGFGVASAASGAAGVPGSSGTASGPGALVAGTGGELYTARCRDHVDRAGAPLRVRAQLAVTGRLAVAVLRCATGAACQPAGWFEYANVGVAFELADVDRDGTAELISSSFVAPGDPDVVKVVSLGGDDRKPVFKKSFNGGVVGIAVVETTSLDAPLVIAAVRLAGATRIDLWRLN